MHREPQLPKLHAVIIQVKLIQQWSIDQIAQEIIVNHNEDCPSNEKQYNKHRKTITTYTKAEANRA